MFFSCQCPNRGWFSRVPSFRAQCWGREEKSVSNIYYSWSSLLVCRLRLSKFFPHWLGESLADLWNWCWRCFYFDCPNCCSWIWAAFPMCSWLPSCYWSYLGLVFQCLALPCEPSLSSTAVAPPQIFILVRGSCHRRWALQNAKLRGGYSYLLCRRKCPWALRPLPLRPWLLFSRSRSSWESARCTFDSASSWALHRNWAQSLRIRQQSIRTGRRAPWTHVGPSRESSPYSRNAYRLPPRDSGKSIIGRQIICNNPTLPSSSPRKALASGAASEHS